MLNGTKSGEYDGPLGMVQLGAGQTVAGDRVMNSFWQESGRIDGRESKAVEIEKTAG